MCNITDLTCWKNIAPAVFVFKYNSNVGFIIIILDMLIDPNYKDTDISHPFGFANLYVSSNDFTEDDELFYISDLLVENKTITFCMEIANAVSTEWDRRGL